MVGFFMKGMHIGQKQAAVKTLTDLLIKSIYACFKETSKQMESELNKAIGLPDAAISNTCSIAQGIQGFTYTLKDIQSFNCYSYYNTDRGSFLATHRSSLYYCSLKGLKMQSPANESVKWLAF